MKRGEIWTIAGGPDHAGKPRPAVILQDDAFDATASVTVCPFTTHAVEGPLLRLPIEPSARNDLRAASQLMIGRRALSSGRLAALGATLDFHHGLLERDLDGARISRSALHRPRDLDGTAAGAVSLGHGVIS